jgi:hypothetical protein
MLKLAAAGMTAFFIAVSPQAYAQNQNQSANSDEHLNAGDLNAFTELRLQTLKSAMQLTPNQEKYWPAIEQAIRTRAQHRVARLQDFASQADQQDSPLMMALDRNPVDFLHRRANALTERAGDLKKLGDAWQPLYDTLSPDQKHRMNLVNIIAFRALMSRIGGDSQDQGFFDEDDEE